MEPVGSSYTSGSFAQRSRDFFTQKHGLPSNEVLCAAFDKTGRLWAGTSKGLAWFDGEKFLSVRPDGKSAPCAVTMLFCDADGC